LFEWLWCRGEASPLFQPAKLFSTPLSPGINPKPHEYIIQAQPFPLQTDALAFAFADSQSMAAASRSKDSRAGACADSWQSQGSQWIYSATFGRMDHPLPLEGAMSTPNKPVKGR